MGLLLGTQSGIGPVKPVHMVFSNNESFLSSLCWQPSCNASGCDFYSTRERFCFHHREHMKLTHSSFSTIIVMMSSCTLDGMTKALSTQFITAGTLQNSTHDIFNLCCTNV